MECNKDEAMRAKGIAQKKMENNDFEGARKAVLKAQNLYPELENITQLLAICNVHCAAKNGFLGCEKDWYGILGVERLADESTIKKQYRRLALVLHPDKNRFPGAEAAFKLIGEAHIVLSDPAKRSSFDSKNQISVRSASSNQPPYHANINPSFRKQYGPQNKIPNGFSGPNQHQATWPNSTFGQGVFLTTCPFCSKKFQYQREYLNRSLRCQECSKPFIAYDIGAQGVPFGPPYSQTGAQHVFSQRMGIPNHCAPKMGVQNNIRFPASGLGPQGSASSKTLGSDSGRWTGSTSKVNGDFKVKEKDSQNVNSVRGGDGGCGMPNGKARTRESGNLKNKSRTIGRKRIMESSESCDTSSSEENFPNPANTGDSGLNSFHFPRRSTRRRQHVSYNESENDDDDNIAPPPMRSQRSKLSDDSEEEQKGTLDTEDLKSGNTNGFPTDDEFKMEHTETSPEGSLPHKNTVNGKLKGRGDASNMPGTGAKRMEEIDDSQSDSDEKIYDCPDPEFNDFDKGREESCFALDQIWACYDTFDGMPRFYAQIRKVGRLGFNVRITWLEAEPEDEAEKNWVSEELPVGCGRFKRGSSQDTAKHFTFSHQVHYGKGKKRNTFIIYPRKGETWALFKDWDVRWSCNQKNSKHFKYEIVEVLLDFVADKGIEVAYLDKVRGFVSIFQQTRQSEIGSFLIKPNELFRFSHRIPCFVMVGTERGVPEGSFELDPAALPLNPVDLWYPDMAKVCSENMDAEVHCSLQKSTKSKGKGLASESSSIPEDVVDLDD